MVFECNFFIFPDKVIQLTIYFKSNFPVNIDGIGIVLQHLKQILLNSCRFKVGN